MHAPPVARGDDAVAQSCWSPPAHVAGTAAQGLLPESMTTPHAFGAQVFPLLPNSCTANGLHCSPIGSPHAQPHWAGGALSPAKPSNASV
jgi:hypothetical protein